MAQDTINGAALVGILVLFVWNLITEARIGAEVLRRREEQETLRRDIARGDTSRATLTHDAKVVAAGHDWVVAGGRARCLSCGKVPAACEPGKLGGGS